MQALMIATQLIEQIKLGTFIAGDKLPSERNLSISFSCNRLTLQESLGYLESQGYIYSEKRKGWFIAEKPLHYYWKKNKAMIDFCSYYIQNSEQIQLQSTLNFIKTIAAPAPQAKLLGVAPLSAIYQIERIHFIKKHPSMVSVHYCDKQSFPKLEKHSENELGSSLYLSYQHFYHCQLITKQLTIQNCAFPENVAELLQAPKVSRALLLTHFIYKEDHFDRMTPIEICYEYWRPHALTLTIE